PRRPRFRAQGARRTEAPRRVAAQPRAHCRGECQKEGSRRRVHRKRVRDMMLPLPTVSNIDVTAERLKDVERDAARPLPDLAGGATKALQVGAAAVEMGEQDKARQEAQWFQKEYVDKGWEGAEKLWQETGADP